MQIDKWNEVMLDWYFSGPAGSRAYFRVDDAELRRINIEVGLGMEDPSSDLLHAVRLNGLRYAESRGQQWHGARADADVVPPWLPYLALTVLVVERQTELGSTAFYDPLSEMLGLPRRLSQFSYEDTFYTWWIELAQWLDNANNGARGVSTWKRIPSEGLRTVIGHPYTQIFLHRDERMDIDEFLGSLESLEPGDIEITDEQQAATSLLEEFRRWAIMHRGLSARLRSTLAGSDKNVLQSLGFVLLDRLLDLVERVDDRRAERVIRIVPTLDDWMERRLRLSVIAPSDVSIDRPLIFDVDGTRLELYEPGQPARLPIEPTSEVLGGGLRIEASDDIALVLSPRPVYSLAARTWDEWCGVPDIQFGEQIYVLAEDAAVGSVLAMIEGSPAAMAGVPAGWQLFGPATLRAGIDPSKIGLRNSTDSVPRLVGGLPIDHRQYLHGGEPRVTIPSGLHPVLVDGSPADLDSSESVDLALAQLSPGAHAIVAGPYRLTFHTLTFERPPIQLHFIGRTKRGNLLAETNDEILMCGGSLLPRRHRMGPTVLSPLSKVLHLLGPPGECAAIEPTRAQWRIDSICPITCASRTRGQRFRVATESYAFPGGPPVAPTDTGGSRECPIMAMSIRTPGTSPSSGERWWTALGSHPCFWIHSTKCRIWMT